MLGSCSSPERQHRAVQKSLGLDQTSWIPILVLPRYVTGLRHINNPFAFSIEQDSGECHLRQACYEIGESTSKA